MVRAICMHRCVTHDCIGRHLATDGCCDETASRRLWQYTLAEAEAQFLGMGGVLAIRHVILFFLLEVSNFSQSVSVLLMLRSDWTYTSLSGL